MDTKKTKLFVGVTLTPVLMDWLHSETGRYGESMSQVVRKLIIQEMERRAPLAGDLCGLGGYDG